MLTNRTYDGRTRGSPGQGPKGLKKQTFFYKRSKNQNRKSKISNSESVNTINKTNSNERPEVNNQFPVEKTNNQFDQQNKSNKSQISNSESVNTIKDNTNDHFSHKEAPSLSKDMVVVGGASQ